MSDPSKKGRMPKKIGRYIVEKELGRGAFGIVYKGTHAETQHIAAIKSISIRKCSKEQIQGVLTEISVLKQLNSTYVVRYIGHKKTKKRLYIYIEFVENGSLKDLIQKNGPLPEEKCADFTYQVLKALEYVHREGVIHRDIKGANILLTMENVVKLADFGVASDFQDADTNPAGTPYWMAPEVIEFKYPNPTSDIWSVGALCVELLTGTPPYFNLPTFTALYRIVQEKSAPIPTEIPLTDRCRKFLLECFERDVKQRKTARELLRHPWFHKIRKRERRKRREARERAERGEEEESVDENVRKRKEGMKKKRKSMANILGSWRLDLNKSRGGGETPGNPEGVEEEEVDGKERESEEELSNSLISAPPIEDPEEDGKKSRKSKRMKKKKKKKKKSKRVKSKSKPEGTYVDMKKNRSEENIEIEAEEDQKGDDEELKGEEGDSDEEERRRRKREKKKNKKRKSKRKKKTPMKIGIQLKTVVDTTEKKGGDEGKTFSRTPPPITPLTPPEEYSPLNYPINRESLKIDIPDVDTDDEFATTSDDEANDTIIRTQEPLSLDISSVKLVEKSSAEEEEGEEEDEGESDSDEGKGEGESISEESGSSDSDPDPDDEPKEEKDEDEAFNSRPNYQQQETDDQNALAKQVQVMAIFSEIDPENEDEVFQAYEKFFELYNDPEYFEMFEHVGGIEFLIPFLEHTNKEYVVNSLQYLKKMLGFIMMKEDSFKVEGRKINEDKMRELVNSLQSLIINDYEVRPDAFEMFNQLAHNAHSRKIIFEEGGIEFTLRLMEQLKFYFGGMDILVHFITDKKLRKKAAKSLSKKKNAKRFSEILEDIPTEEFISLLELIFKILKTSKKVCKRLSNSSLFMSVVRNAFLKSRDDPFRRFVQLKIIRLTFKYSNNPKWFVLEMFPLVQQAYISQKGMVRKDSRKIIQSFVQQMKC